MRVPLTGFAGVVQGALDLLDAELGLSLVQLPRQLDELGVEVVLARLEREVERIDREGSARPFRGPDRSA